MKALKTISSLSVCAILAVCSVNPAVASANPENPANFTTSVSGIDSPTLPLFADFGEVVSMTMHGAGDNEYFTLSGFGVLGLFATGDGNYGSIGPSDLVYYQANFNPQGELLTSINGLPANNVLDIYGTLPALPWDGGVTRGPGLLLSANLVAVGEYSNFALGFETVFTGGSLLNVDPTATGQSLWLYSPKGDVNFEALVSAIAANDLNSLFPAPYTRTTYTGIVSLASVPVPATVWMFGAGLFLMAGWGRFGRRESLAA